MSFGEDAISAMHGKMWRSFLECVEQIKSGKRVILFSRDYVMISRNIYDKIIEEQYPSQKEVSYDHNIMDNWLRDRFLKSDK